MTNVRYLSNGLTVVLEPMRHLKSVSFGIWIKVGSVNETKENNGISHVIEHMFFKGTSNRSAKKLADDMAELGGNMNAYTSKECTTFYVTTLDAYIGKAVELCADLLKNSLFQEADLKKELEVILEEIDMYNDSPEDLVHEMLQNQVWKDHPLGYLISGEKQVVSQFKRQDLIAFHDTYYTADRMVISVAGSFEEESLFDLLEQEFSFIPRRGVLETATVPTYYPSVYHKSMDIEQVHMNIGFPCIDYHSEEKYTLSVINSIFGGSDNSRLFQRIREEQGLVYSIYSYESLFQNAGLFQIDVVLNPKKREIVFEEIMQIIEEFKTTIIKEEELTRVKEQLKVELMIGVESSRNRMSNHGKSMLMRKQITPIEVVIEKIQKVSPEQVQMFAQKYWKQENHSISLVGNLI